MNTKHFLTFLILAVASLANAEIFSQPEISPNAASETKCIQLKKETLASREECMQKAYQVLECQFDREARQKGLAAKLNRSEVTGQSKVKVIQDRNNKKSIRSEVLSYGLFDQNLQISVAGNATWWSADNSCTY